MPRINFVSFTFLFAFGMGSFVGIGMALLAVALARPEDETRVIEREAVAVASTPTPTLTATPVPTGTPTPEPVPMTTAALQVRIGPASGYAILGTLAAGSEIGLQGRDDSGDWLAIRFPPGSSARGWIRAEDVTGLSVVQVLRLDVLQASLVETSPRLPFATSTPSLLEGNDGLPAEIDTPAPSDTPAASETPGTSPTPRATSTSTPRPSGYGPTDLVLGPVSLVSEGRIRIVVENRGPGSVPNVVVLVMAEGFAPEELLLAPLPAGEIAVLETSTTRITERTSVTVSIDPAGVLTDVARGNNSRSQELVP